MEFVRKDSRCKGTVKKHVSVDADFVVCFPHGKVSLTKMVANRVGRVRQSV